MDLLKLDPATFKPTEIVEGITTLIWTTRLWSNGEFELHTPMVAEMSALIPEGSLISLLDSPEVMVVETMAIGYDSEDQPELTITGRTVDVIFESRVMDGTAPFFGRSWVLSQQYTTAEMATAIMWNYIANDTNEDIIGPAWIGFPQNAIANAVVTDSTDIVEATKQWSFSDGVVATRLRDAMATGPRNMGIRTIRPIGSEGKIASFDITRDIAVRGIRTLTDTSSIQALRFDLFNGKDRSRNQNTNAPVIFSSAAGDLNHPSYLFSSKDVKNVVRIVSSENDLWVWPTADQTASGLDLKILFMDGGQTQPNQDNAAWEVGLQQKARTELVNHGRKAIFDSAISPLSEYEFGRDYFLGDKVTLQADYGFEQTMLVTEYVRTQDSDGDRGYPTLIVDTSS